MVVGCWSLVVGRYWGLVIVRWGSFWALIVVGRWLFWGVGRSTMGIVLGPPCCTALAITGVGQYYLRAYSGLLLKDGVGC